jgi:hypothetical protein
MLRRKVEKRVELKEIKTLGEMVLEREEEVVRYYLEKERGRGEGGFVFGARVGGREGETEKERMKSF